MSNEGEQPTSVEWKGANSIKIYKMQHDSPTDEILFAWVPMKDADQAREHISAIIAEERRQAKIEGGIEAIYDLLDTTGDFPIKVEEALAKVAELKLELKEGENTSEQ